MDDNHLSLEWVYGYRGDKCHSNLFYSSHNEIVYFVARVAVVLNQREVRQRFFIGHSDDILCLGLHPQLVLAATGQKGENAYICVWDTTTVQPISILQNGHVNGVCAIDFSSSGKWLGSVDLDSTMVIWDWKKGRIVSTTIGSPDRVLDLRFHPAYDYHLATCGVKHIKFWTLKGSTLLKKIGQFGEVGDIQTLLCLAFGRSEATFAGTLSGDIYIWKRNNLKKVIKHAHKGGIVSIHQSNEGYATGGKDGVVRLWDLQFKPIVCLDFTQLNKGYKGLSVRSVCWRENCVLVGTQNGEIFEVSCHNEEVRCLVEGHYEGKVCGLSTHPHELTFATAGDDGMIKIWNGLDRQLHAKMFMGDGAKSCAFSPDGNEIAVGLNSGVVFVLVTKTLDAVAQIRDQKSEIRDLKYSPDGVFLAVGCIDGILDLYEAYKGYHHVNQFIRCSGDVRHINWSFDSRFIRVNSTAQQLIRASDGIEVTNLEEIDPLKWFSWTGVLGREVTGIYPKYSDDTDVNSTDVNFEAGALVAASETGLVKLFNFPTLKKGSRYRYYEGHSMQVKNVRFTFDNLRVVTTGGTDCAILQWRFVAGEEPNVKRIANLRNNNSALDEDGEQNSSELELLDSDVEREIEQNARTSFSEEENVSSSNVHSDSDQPMAGNGGIRKEAPSSGLLMEFVFGYRSHDCRNNLVYTLKGEIAYHAAAIGIVYNRQTNVQRFYLGHTGDITSFAVHPLDDFIATGQAGHRPSIHVWDVDDTMRSISIMEGSHRRGISALDFSGDGTRLASVGLENDHFIIIWNWRKGQQLAIVKGHSSKIFMVKWNPVVHFQIVTVGNKHIKFWSQTGGGFVFREGNFGHKQKMETMLCIAFGKQRDICYTGGVSGSVFVWQGNRLSRKVDCHQGPLFCMHILDQGFVCGGKDGTVSLWDEFLERRLRTYTISQAHVVPGSRGMLVKDRPAIRSCVLGHAKILVGTQNGDAIEVEKDGSIRILLQSPSSDNDISGLAVHPTMDWCATVNNGGTLCLWDLTSRHMVLTHSLCRPAKCLAVSPDGCFLSVGFTDGSFSVLSIDSGKTLVHFHDRKSVITDTKFSPDGKHLAVACSDKSVDIYSIPAKKRISVCHCNASVNHVDWSVDGKLLQVDCGERLFFEVPFGKRYKVSPTELSLVSWATWTSVFATAQEKSSDNRLVVNSADLSHDQLLLVQGDNDGFIKLFKYPLEESARFRRYRADGRRVTHVQWTHNDRHLISTGDALIIWRLDPSKDKRSLVQNESEESEPDDEEDGGYDSDVNEEKRRFYESIMSKKPPPPNDQIAAIKRRFKTSKLFDQPETQTASDIITIPDLVLEHVFGYRGFDCRNNLFYLSDGCSIIYCSGGVGIIQDLHTGHQYHYLGHTDGIVCLTYNSHKNTVATAQCGNDTAVHIWQVHDLKLLSIIRIKRTNGLSSIHFSENGKFLLTVGLDTKHTISIWKWNRGKKIASADGHNQRIFDARFRPGSNTDFVTVGVAHVKFWSLAGSALNGRRGLFAMNGYNYCSTPTMLSMAFGMNPVTYTGSTSGNIFVWRNHILDRIVTAAHEGAIFVMHSSNIDGLVVSSGKEAGNKTTIKLWDQELKRCKPFSIAGKVIKSIHRNVGKILIGTKDNCIFEIVESTASIHMLQQNHVTGHVWGLAAHPHLNVIATCSDDATLRLWDIKSKRLLVKMCLPAAGKNLDYNPEGNLIAVGLASGEMIIFATPDMIICHRRRDRNSSINDIRFSPDGSLLVVGYEEARSSIDIYDVAGNVQLLRVSTCKGIESSVKNLDFSVDTTFIRVITGNYDSLIFSVPKASFVDDEGASERVIKWATSRSIVSWETIGTWSDKCSVTCMDVDDAQKVVATGDDGGNVKLFQFPCTNKKAKYKSSSSHSFPITCVRFTHDGHLVSTDDANIFIWRYHPTSKETKGAELV